MNLWKVTPRVAIFALAPGRPFYLGRPDTVTEVDTCGLHTCLSRRRAADRGLWMQVLRTRPSIIRVRAPWNTWRAFSGRSLGGKCFPARSLFMNIHGIAIAWPIRAANMYFICVGAA